MMDSEIAHFFCDHDFKFKMLGGHLCKFCGIGKTPTSLGIKSNLLACKVYTNSICHDNLPDASKKFQEPHDELYLTERADLIFFMHQVRLDFEIDQQAFHLGCQIMDMLFTVENAESITSQLGRKKFNPFILPLICQTIANKTQNVQRATPDNVPMLLMCYKTLGLDYRNEPKRFEKDLDIMNKLEIEICQVVDWNFSDQTYFDLVVGYLNKGILLPDDKISTAWLDFYAKNVKGKNFTGTLQNSLDLSFVKVLPKIAGPFTSCRKLKDLEAHELNDLCIVIEAFCLELCYKLQFQFNYLCYHKNELVSSIIMMIRSYFFDPKEDAGATRISKLAGQEFYFGENSCFDKIKTYFVILYEELAKNSDQDVEIVQEYSEQDSEIVQEYSDQDRQSREENSDWDLENLENEWDQEDLGHKEIQSKKIIAEHDERKFKVNKRGTANSFGVVELDNCQTKTIPNIYVKRIRKPENLEPEEFLIPCVGIELIDSGSKDQDVLKRGCGSSDGSGGGTLTSNEDTGKVRMLFDSDCDSNKDPIHRSKFQDLKPPKGKDFNSIKKIQAQNPRNMRRSDFDSQTGAIQKQKVVFNQENKFLDLRAAFTRNQKEIQNMEFDSKLNKMVLCT